ncbi:MAG: TIGR04282 family arsenosugar biosynthesis glycosyltransferase [Gammaproteobacteria bacterium]|nr:TIGR04282 family arsenosugar biosynthesis glycosyltransferase [Gammaproteobacteria bacterium]
MADSTLLIQFAKSAVPGSVKTRLVPPLTTQQAADLHTSMVVHTCATLCGAGLGEVQLWLSGEQQQPLLQSCREVGNFSQRQQCRGDLGKKLAHAVQAGLSHSERVIVVGSDAPAIDAAYLHAADRALDTTDVVLGPAWDGGYVLLGLKRFARHLFMGIEWGTDSVLEDTLQRVEELAWSCSLLAELRDIDRPEDLRFVPDSLSLQPAGQAQAERLASRLASFAAAPGLAR